VTPPPTIRWLTAVSWFSLIVFAGSSAVVSAALEDIGADFAIGLSLRGVLSVAGSAVLAAAAFWTGYLADHIRKRRLLAGAMFVMACALLCIARARQYGVLLGAMLLLGAGKGMVEGAISPLCADLHPDRVDAQMNVLHAFYSVGLVGIGLLSGLAMNHGTHWRIAVGALAIPAVVAAIAFLSGRYPVPHSEVYGRTPIREIIRPPAFWLLAFVMLLTAGVEGGLTFWFPSFVRQEYGTSVLVGGSGLALFGVAMAAGRFGAGAVSHRVPLPSMIFFSCLLCASATLGLTLFRGLWPSMACAASAGLFVACFWPSVLAVASRIVARGSATTMAMLSVAGVVGFGGLPWLIGSLADRFGLRAAFLVLPASLLLAALATRELTSRGGAARKL